MLEDEIRNAFSETISPHYETILYILIYLLIAFLGNFLLIPYILETSQVRKRRISDVCSLHWTCNVPNVHALDPWIRHILHSQPERLTKRCKSDFLTMDYAFKNICKYTRVQNVWSLLVCMV